MSKKNSLIDQWKVMEQIKKDGLAKSIGVSNFREEDLQAIQDKWEIPPAVNQVSCGFECAGSELFLAVSVCSSDRDPEARRP